MKTKAEFAALLKGAFWQGVAVAILTIVISVTVAIITFAAETAWKAMKTMWAILFLRFRSLFTN